MMNMMYTNGPAFNLGFGILWGVHVLAVLAFFIGIVFFIAFALKTFSNDQLKKWAWGLAVFGIVACLLTIGAMGHAWAGRGAGMFTTRGMPMMGQWQGQGGQEGAKSADQLKEEAEGKALFDQLKAKQTTCAKLTDDDFELIGEYVMGQRTGASHEQMNAMLKQMMGDIGEAQMHIVLGKSATGCATGTAAAGMMGGAGMMR